MKYNAGSVREKSLVDITHVLSPVHLPGHPASYYPSFMLCCGYLQVAGRQQDNRQQDPVKRPLPRLLILTKEDNCAEEETDGEAG